MSRMLAELLLECGWWPPQVQFELADLRTVLAVAEQRREMMQ